MIQLIKAAFQQFIDDIDSRNSNISEQDQKDLLEIINRVMSNNLSKTEAANYIGVSKSTFDNYIRKGFIPKGKKRSGFKELSWNKYDLDKYLDEK